MTVRAGGRWASTGSRFRVVRRHACRCSAPVLQWRVISHHRLSLAVALAVAACSGRDVPEPAERATIEAEIRARLVAVTDLSRPDVVNRMLSLYPENGRVISAAAGRVTTTRDSLAAGIVAFWENVGRNMVEPRWVWDSIHVDVLGRDAAVSTGTYRIPHRTPAGAPHEIGGAWTALFVRRGDRWMVIQEHLSDAPR